MLSVYPAIFYVDPSGGYSVVFPDLNHLATCGDDMQEAMEMAVDCLAGYLFSEKIDGNSIPDPTPFDQVDPYCEDDTEEERQAVRFVNMVSVDVEAYAEKHFNKAVKRTVSIPQWLNNRAMAQNINFSKVMKKALLQELDIAQ
ncbi:type II toxin-antitoxin system HicB family antitoxin [Anaerovibrio sp. RM50]|uniref:type II toxin-antitoxin system HicB family antitoxin n=1 Tax=Anaerovibrio sp. RM50 TaxID=1200557 RepID=UPI000483466E|nr:type II toxin-antitoxin system HicB family antitoxin [Anaerovibrio sp. RM50]